MQLIKDVWHIVERSRARSNLICPKRAFVPKNVVQKKCLFCIILRGIILITRLPYLKEVTVPLFLFVAFALKRPWESSVQHFLSFKFQTCFVLVDESSINEHLKSNKLPRLILLSLCLIDSLKDIKSSCQSIIEVNREVVKSENILTPSICPFSQEMSFEALLKTLLLLIIL